MDPSLGPLLYCLCIIAGCAVYFHYYCDDRRSKVAVQPMAYTSAASVKEEPQEGDETETKARPTKKQRIAEWASSMLDFSKKSE